MASVEDLERVYVVPQNRNFVWPTIEVGRKVTVPHVKTPLGESFTVPFGVGKVLFVVYVAAFLTSLAIFAPKARRLPVLQYCRRHVT